MHFSVIKGYKKIPGLCDTIVRPERGGLVLASVTVCHCFLYIPILMYSVDVKVQRALKLWAIGAITLQMVKSVKAGKGKKQISLPKFWVLEDGTKESTLFNDVTWGAITHARMDFVNNNLHKSSLAKVISRAKDFVSSSYQDTAEAVEDEDLQMVDLSDDECMQIWPIPLALYSDLTQSTEAEQSFVAQLSVHCLISKSHAVRCGVSAESVASRLQVISFFLPCVSRLLPYAFYLSPFVFYVFKPS
jgi:hypothetical protein